MTRRLGLQVAAVGLLVLGGVVLLDAGDEICLFSFGLATSLGVHWWGA